MVQSVTVVDPHFTAEQWALVNAKTEETLCGFYRLAKKAKYRLVTVPCLMIGMMSRLRHASVVHT